VVPVDAPPLRVVSTARVMKAMDELDRLVARKPAEAKEALASIIENIVLMPRPDGYTAKLTVRNGTGRAPEGGGLFVQSGWGARNTSFSRVRAQCLQGFWRGIARRSCSPSFSVLKSRRHGTARGRQIQRAAAAPESSGRLLKAMAACGAALWMALTTASNSISRFGGRRTPAPTTTQS